MTRKPKSIARLISCFALAAIMMFSMMLPALAFSSGTGPNDEAEAAITKRLKMPVNTTVPSDAQFTFTFEAIGVDGGTNPAGMPAIPPVTVDLTSGTWQYTDPSDGSVIYEVKETSNFIAGITEQWPDEGVYTYRVKETAGSIDITDGTKEGATYSDACYDIEIWIAKDAATGTLYVQFVDAKTVAGFIDEYYPGDLGGNKVDPTPGGVNLVPGTTIEDDFSQVIFTNSYWKSGGGGTTDPEQTALEVIKKITGNGAVLTTRFSFDITVIQPSVITPASPAQTYKVCVLDEGDAIITSASHYDGTIDANGYFTVSSNSLFVVSLTNKERLAFVDLHVGSKVAVEETEHADYKAKYVNTFGPNANTEFTALAENTAWGFPRTGTNPDAGPHYIKDNAGANISTFTNIRIGATPTGISVDNLPYIVLITIALAGLVGFVAIKSRKAAKDHV